MLTQSICSASVGFSRSLIVFGLFKVQTDSCCSTFILVKTSKPSKLFGVSSVPKGLRAGAFATNWRRVYSSNISGLPFNQHLLERMGGCCRT